MPTDETYVHALDVWGGFGPWAADIRRFGMDINWKVRIKNKAFWVALIPALLLLIQQVCVVFGVTLDFGELQAQLVAIVGTVFALLAILGIVADPTTAGVGDSEQAMGYTEPKEG